MRRLLLLLPLLLIVAGCGAPSSPSHPVTTTPVVTYLPPDSARTPDGARPQAPPVALPPSTGRVMHISAAGVRLIAGFEGFGSCPYWDPYGHVWTRGFGETEGITRGSPCISRATGETRLRYLVEARYEWAIRGLGVALNRHQWDALCSFAWNLGAGIFQGTLRYDLQHRQFYPAASMMLQYDHAGGQVLEGLRTRRLAEVRLFLAPERRPAPPKPTPSQLRRELYRAYGYRTALRHLLARHQCRPPLHARPRRDHTKCGIWLAHGVSVNRQIKALHAQGIH